MTNDINYIIFIQYMSQYLINDKMTLSIENIPFINIVSKNKKRKTPSLIDKNKKIYLFKIILILYEHLIYFSKNIQKYFAKVNELNETIDYVVEYSKTYIYISIIDVLNYKLNEIYLQNESSNFIELLTYFYMNEIIDKSILIDTIKTFLCKNCLKIINKKELTINILSIIHIQYIEMVFYIFNSLLNDITNKKNITILISFVKNIYVSLSNNDKLILQKFILNKLIDDHNKIIYYYDVINDVLNGCLLSIDTLFTSIINIYFEKTNYDDIDKINDLFKKCIEYEILTELDIKRYIFHSIKYIFLNKKFDFLSTFFHIKCLSLSSIFSTNLIFSLYVIDLYLTNIIYDDNIDINTNTYYIESKLMSFNNYIMSLTNYLSKDNYILLVNYNEEKKMEHLCKILIVFSKINININTYRIIKAITISLLHNNSFDLSHFEYILLEMFKNKNCYSLDKLTKDKFNELIENNCDKNIFYPFFILTSFLKIDTIKFTDSFYLKLPDCMLYFVEYINSKNYILNIDLIKKNICNSIIS